MPHPADSNGSQLSSNATLGRLAKPPRQLLTIARRAIEADSKPGA
jgi:hypothetical protein